jgi:NAD+ synthase
MIPELQIDCDKETGRIVSFIFDFVSRNFYDGVVLGLSGGIDSALAAALCAKALSPAKVKALVLPERDSSPESEDDAKLCAEQIGIEYRVENLSEALESLGCYRSAASALARLKGPAHAAFRLFPDASRKGYIASLRGSGSRQFREFVAFYRMKHRLRLVSLCREAEEGNLAVVSCANRTEFETGFFVRYGDDSGDLAPLKHLYKMQVFQMGEQLRLPERIVKKKPSPDLFAGVKDEEIMGISYEELDAILVLLASGLDDDAIVRRGHVDRESIQFAREIKALSQKLRDAPASLL